MGQWSRWQALYTLFSSMRFAISLLSVLAIASVVGTVLKQAEPYANYIAQFGPFWFPVFEALGLYDVYHASWFLTILAFLVLSTSSCIYRNGPSMLQEMASYRDKVTVRTLQRLPMQMTLPLEQSLQACQAQVEAYLFRHGFRYRVTARGAGGADILIAAKAGSYHRLGYLFTHCGIVVICVGGLIDGNLPLKALQWTGQKVIEVRDIPQSQVPAQSRLGPDNQSFRGNVNIPEGSSANVVFLNVGDGYFVQDLPFTVALNKFHIEHYTTGQPRDFASDIVLTDRQTGERIERTIRVNHPLIHRGIAIYQASFADGGTRMQFRAWPLFSQKPQPFDIAGVVHQSTTIHNGQTELRLEVADFRPFNIEDLSVNNTPQEPVKTAGVAARVFAQMGSGAADASRQDLRNVGPSVQFRLRDAQGQASEFSNYMLPLQLEGAWYLMSGVRASPNASFRYLRLPLDSQGRIERYMRLRALLLDAKSWPLLGQRFAAQAGGSAVTPQLRARLAESAERVLQLFATNGFQSVSDFIDQSVPEAERDKAAEIYVKVLEGVALAAWQWDNQQHTPTTSMDDPQALRFVRDTLTSVSDSFAYGAPFYVQLTQFEEVKASGLQLTRAPGQNIVYGGCLLLVLGIFVMLYIRERRLWILLQAAHSDTHAQMVVAMASNRNTLDNDKEFIHHQQAFAAMSKG